MAQISLNKLPWHAQIGAFVVLTLGAIGAFYYYYEMPARADMEVRQQKLTALRADIATGLNTAKKLPEFRAEVTDLESRLTNLKQILPEEKDAADLLRRMQTVAAQSNLTIKSFRPAAIVTRQLHAEWPINLELEGTYHNLALFCDRVGKFTRIVNISSIDLKGRERQDANNTVTASCVATTFVLIEKPAPKPGAKAAAPAVKGT